MTGPGPEVRIFGVLEVSDGQRPQLRFTLVNQPVDGSAAADGGEVGLLGSVEVIEIPRRHLMPPAPAPGPRDRDVADVEHVGDVEDAADVADMEDVEHVAAFEDTEDLEDGEDNDTLADLGDVEHGEDTEAVEDVADVAQVVARTASRPQPGNRDRARPRVERPMRHGRRDRLARVLSVTTRALASAGVTLMVMSLLATGPPPQPPSSAIGSLGPVEVPNAYRGGAGADVTTTRTAPDPHATAVEPDPPAPDPIAIDIPSIEVRSTLQHLGRTAQNTLAVPSGPRYDEAAWFEESAAPGSVGTAVVLGHVDSAIDGPSVFYELGALRPGDDITITRTDGSTVTFTVDGVRRYPKDQFPSLLIYGDTDHPALRLITCGGAFDRSTGSYLDNIVVFASLNQTDLETA